MRPNKNREVFFALLRAGLWEKETQLMLYGEVDYQEIMRFAEEQTVVGLITAGLEHVTDVAVPKIELLQFIGQTLQIEESNKVMNADIADLVEKMRDAGIYTLLVKGQGIAQCYERPLWRSNGDVDFFSSKEDYQKTVAFITPLSPTYKNGGRYSKESCFTINKWPVEVHGSLRTGLSSRVDATIDEVQQSTFRYNEVRIWDNNGTEIFLPEPNVDVFFVFTHFIKHFYKEGMSLRQVCDWCRLLWTYREKVNEDLLLTRLKKAGLMDEWRAFAALAVNRLGMPADAMPLYDKALGWDRKADRICILLLKGYSGEKLKDTYRVAKIFPGKTFTYLPGILLNVNMLKIKERLFGE